MNPRLAGASVIFALAVGVLAAQTPITIDYPAAGSLFPPEFPAPQFLWRDAARDATVWRIEVQFGDGAAAIHTTSRGERMTIGPIDPRCVAPTNAPPRLTPDQGDAHTWRPDLTTWNTIKSHSVAAPARILITGFRGAAMHSAVSRGTVDIQTSTDAVGAPIFYRDVPLMPSETETGVIKPLAAGAIPLIAWRLRDVSETASHLLMEGLHSCANCHSFSGDGKTMGMDVDGPRNDKGLYAVTALGPKTEIRNEDVVAWSSFQGKLGSPLRVGFMSQISPDGRFVTTTINDPGDPQSEYQRRKNPTDLILNYYVANFKDYRFLQVFYPTRGILAWYSRETGQLQPLPGADDPRFVHTSAAWSPDGKYLVFSRAEARDAYTPTPGGKLAAYANDPNETQIRYDLYRIPFNGGKGGQAQAIAGASANGMSNSFPKVSPDGRWIVYVQARNGQLMRPDSQLYIVPAAGGAARRMRCNTPIMNSWHSFSPNGRWMVFSSKARSPYTQMYLTHIDENGNDTPAILIESTTASNRAVNLPEFVNVPAGGLVSMASPASDFYRIVDSASDLMNRKQFTAAATEWNQALKLQPGDASAHYNLGLALFQSGQTSAAIEEYQKSLQLSPDYPEAHNNLGGALSSIGKVNEAIVHFQKAVDLDPNRTSAQTNLATLQAQQGRFAAAIPHFEIALRQAPGNADTERWLGLALGMTGRSDEAIAHLEKAVQLSSGKDVTALDLLAGTYAQAGRFGDAARILGQALAIVEQQGNRQAADAIRARLTEFQAKK